MSHLSAAGAASGATAIDVAPLGWAGGAGGGLGDPAFALGADVLSEAEAARPVSCVCGWEMAVCARAIGVKASTKRMDRLMGRRCARQAAG